MIRAEPATAVARQLDESAQLEEIALLREQVAVLEQHLHKRDEQRRALLHILSDLHELNRRLSNQRKAMLHILADYEQDRRRLGSHAERADNSRRALLHILQDAHHANLKLEDGRKAMIHIMGDLHETTEEIKQREQELVEKQEQLVQAGKLATLGELTTGVAHELNNPLNNIGLFLGNSIDLIEMDQIDTTRILRDLRGASQQVRKASEIISHLRTFGRAAPVGRESMAINQVIRRALSLVQEQFRIRQIAVELDLDPAEPLVNGSPIQLEQVFINLLANARDALTDAPRKLIKISSAASDDVVIIIVSDTGPGIPKGLEERIFDPFFTTKEVGQGTGLGLSITYGILKDHKGTISLDTSVKDGATFRIKLPLAVS